MDKGNYSHEFKEAVLKRMLLPENTMIAQLAEEYRIGKSTLHNWCTKAGITPSRE